MRQKGCRQKERAAIEGNRQGKERIRWRGRREMRGSRRQ